jgi:hypothetical protein
MFRVCSIVDSSIATGTSTTSTTVVPETTSTFQECSNCVKKLVFSKSGFENNFSIAEVEVYDSNGNLLNQNDFESAFHCDACNTGNALDHPAYYAIDGMWIHTHSKEMMSR